MTQRMWNTGAIAIVSKIFRAKHFTFIFLNLKTVTLNDSFPCYIGPEGPLPRNFLDGVLCYWKKWNTGSVWPCMLVWLWKLSVCEKRPATVVPEKYPEGAHSPARFPNQWKWLSEERWPGAQPGSMAGLTHHAWTDFRSSKNTSIGRFNTNKY